MPIHLATDLAAALIGAMTAVAVWRWRLAALSSERLSRIGPGYAVVLATGAIAGAYLLGTLNLMLSGLPGVGRSILGAFAGAIAAVELYKRSHGIAGSTGSIFVAGFAASAAIGRIGCFLSGLSDQTYGTVTSVPWAKDFGDGLPRHPVQLYESAAMAIFLAGFLALLARNPRAADRYGFYLLAGWYGGMRFLTEFFKPYAKVAGPLDLFQIVSLALVFYAGLMLKGARPART